MRVPFLGLVEPIRVYYIAILIIARVEHPLALAIRARAIERRSRTRLLLHAPKIRFCCFDLGVMQERSCSQTLLNYESGSLASKEPDEQSALPINAYPCKY